MGNRFVNVSITRNTAATSQKGFGLVLILSTDKALAYTEYTDLAPIGVEFGTASKTYKQAAAILGQTPRVDKVAIYGINTYLAADPPTELSAALNTLILTHNDFYYLVCTEQDDAEITELATWVKTQDKLYGATTTSQTLADTLANERVFLQVHNDPTLYVAEAWIGACAARKVGSFTWTFKTLNGITPATFDTTAINNIHSKHGNTYIKEGGVNITSNGKTTSGEWIDVMQGQDYLKARITENTFGLLVREGKVPFTYDGVSMTVAEVEKALKDGATSGIIAKDADGNPLYTITAPDVNEISANDKANRLLPDVNWTATIAGAIENVDINGTMKI